MVILLTWTVLLEINQEFDNIYKNLKTAIYYIQGLTTVRKLELYIVSFFFSEPLSEDSLPLNPSPPVLKVCLDPLNRRLE